MKPTVALFFPSTQGGGVYRVMTNLASGLLKTNYFVDLVIGRVAETQIDLVSENMRTINLQALTILSSLPKLIGYLKKYKPDFLISAQMNVNLTAILACRLSKTGTKLIISEHNDVNSVFSNAKTIKGHIVPLLAKIMYSKANRIVAVSNGVADGLSAWLNIDRSKIQVIYNPLVSDQILQLADKEVNHPWFHSKKTSVILSVGRLEAQKDYFTLINAFALVVEKIPARLLILGDGSQRKSLEKLVFRHNLEGLVDLPGAVKNPFSYMAKADVFVLSSAWEGFPSVLVEAMACGCPLVSTNCPYGPSEILDNGKLGILVPVKDEKSLSNAIISAIEKPKSTNLKESAQRYTIDRATIQYIQLMQEMNGQ